MSKYLNDPVGKPSAMRLMSFFSLGVAVVLTGAVALTSANISSEVILYFLLGAFAPKALQSFAEHKEKEK